MPISKSIITRPANTTAYTAGDVVGGSFTSEPLSNLPATELLLTSFDLRIDVSAIPSGMTSFRLHIYSGAPATIADNAAWTLPADDRGVYIGYVDLGSPADVGATLFCQVDQVNRQVRLGAGETRLYHYLVTNGGFTPAGNSEVYTVTERAIPL